MRCAVQSLAQRRSRLGSESCLEERPLWTSENSSSLADTLEGSNVARQIVFTAKAAKPPATYSQAVKAAGLVFVSGTAPTDPATGALKGTTIQDQTRQCLTNIQAILEEAGSSLDKIVSVTIVLRAGR